MWRLPLCLVLIVLSLTALAEPAGACWRANARRCILLIPPVPAPDKDPGAPATIIVQVPADARLLINEKPTVSTGERRLFTTPALPPGKEFFYVLTAEAYRDGKAVTMTKEVTVSAATTSVVALKDLTPSQPRLPKISDVPPGTPKLVPPKVLAGK